MIKTLLARLALVLGFVPAPAVAVPIKAEEDKPRRRISAEALARSRQAVDPDAAPPEIKQYEPPRGVLPSTVAKSEVLAMDSTDYEYVNAVYGGAYFKGYPYLAMLTQRPEYRKMSETIAKEMTRKWIKLQAKGDGDKTDKITALDKALEKFKVRKLFRKAAELDGFFGRGQIFIDVAKPGARVSSRDDTDELKTVLLRDPAKVTKGGLIGFKLIEPVWTYPSSYNGNDPLAPDYYKPSSWFVMGKNVHSSRLLLFISREVPDLLKAAYNFGGVPLSQLAEPYVENWLRTRDSVSDLIASFSVSGVKTTMGDALQGGDGIEMFARAELFNNIRDNRGLFMLDKDSEEFFQFNTPLSGLDALQAQAQEQLSAVSNIPLVKLLGITPSGLNASSDGEVRVFYDYVKSMQEHIYRENLQHVLDLVQLSEFGEIDPDITFEFVPLWEMSEVERATVRKSDADTDAVLVGAGVISSDEVRERLAADPDSPYHSLEVNNGPGEPDDDTDLGGEDE